MTIKEKEFIKWCKEYIKWYKDISLHSTKRNKRRRRKVNKIKLKSIAGQTQLIIEELYHAENNQIPRWKLRKDHYSYLDKHKFDSIIKTLEMANMIKITKNESEIVIQMLPDAVVSIIEFMEL